TACTAKVHTLVTDDPALVQARHDYGHLYYQPASPLAFHHLQEGVQASLRLNHVATACTSIVNTQIINASSDWRSERQKEIKALSTELPIDPAQVVGFFRETAMGCDWLISRWERLGSQAETNGGWSPIEKDEAFLLLGCFPETGGKRWDRTKFLLDAGYIYAELRILKGFGFPPGRPD